ncbi:uncharacterized protein LOC135483801 [Lineus longissimus]|uniref:uncharacterized protein LOC135483801 n=2 Tax=Lineus longissimus TaxID=88925 RepID=UPI00315DEC4F
MIEWQKDQYGAILGKKTLLVSYGGNCLRIVFSQTSCKMTVNSPDSLQGNHEEADTLIAFHAASVTGSLLIRASDTDVIPYELLENNDDGNLIKLFSSMSSREEPSQKKAEEYVCSLYGMKDVKEVNRARHNKLVQMTGKINQENPMANVKKVDRALLLPCGKALSNKTRRAHYVSIVWDNADSPQPDHDLDPLQYGWKDEHGYYTPDWYPGPAEPDNLFGGDRRSEGVENTDEDAGGQTEDLYDDDTDIDTDSGPDQRK